MAEVVEGDRGVVIDVLVFEADPTFRLRHFNLLKDESPLECLVGEVPLTLLECMDCLVRPLLRMDR